MNTTATPAPDTTSAADLDNLATAPRLVDHPEHDHGRNAITGYVVRRTANGGKILPTITPGCRPGVDVAVYPSPHAYPAARTLAGLLRQHPGAYAVIDNLYACGCRS
jgi:hypothetical protein